MLDPFTAWSRIMAASFAMMHTGMRASQTLSASRDVIDKRSALIGSAIANPLTADHAELGRMLPEKVAAFSAAGTAFWSGWLAWNTALMAEAEHMRVMASRGRAPTPSEWMALAARSAAFGVKSAESGARIGSATIAPVHAKAVSNARRLNRPRR